MSQNNYDISATLSRSFAETVRVLIADKKMMGETAVSPTVPITLLPTLPETNIKAKIQLTGVLEYL